MPLADDAVDINDVADTAAAPREQFDDLAIIGTATTANEPTAGFNTVRPHTTQSGIATDYTEDSDIYAAATEAFGEGGSGLRILTIALEETTHTESFGATTATSSATVSNAPMSGVTDISVTIDGNSPLTNVFTTTSPPAPEGEGTIAEGEAYINTDTGEVEVGTETSGTGTGIEVSYSTLSWSEGLEALRANGADIAVMGNYRFDRSWLGDIDELLTWADANNVAVPVPYANAQQYADAQEALTLAHDIGSYVPSDFGLAIANESADEVGGAVGGKFAVNRPWYDIYNKTLGVGVAVPTRLAPLAGSPSDPNTFEGGTGATGGSDGGAGPSNVLYDDGGTVLSNSLSMAGTEADNAYLDVSRTRAFVKDRIRAAVSDQFRDSDLRFNSTGRTRLHAAIEEELSPFVGDAANQPFRDLEIYVPPADEVPEADRKNRRWTGIQVAVTYSAPVHTAQIDLKISV